MGLSPEEIGRLSIWEYQAALWHWNAAAEEARGDDDAFSGVEAPTADDYYRDLASLRAMNDPRIRV